MLHWHWQDGLNGFDTDLKWYVERSKSGQLTA
jgi:hypothetical protein